VIADVSRALCNLFVLIWIAFAIAVVGLVAIMLMASQGGRTESGRKCGAGHPWGDPAK
jgi:hypothetical protein